MRLTGCQSTSNYRRVDIPVKLQLLCFVCSRGSVLHTCMSGGQSTRDQFILPVALQGQPDVQNERVPIISMSHHTGNLEVIVLALLISQLLHVPDTSIECSSAASGSPSWGSCILASCRSGFLLLLGACCTAWGALHDDLHKQHHGSRDAYTPKFVRVGSRACVCWKPPENRMEIATHSHSSAMQHARD